MPTTRSPAEALMNVIEFFEYLAAKECTADLARALADLWVEHEIAGAFAA